jgi:hypothetical protein
MICVSFNSNETDGTGRTGTADSSGAPVYWWSTRSCNRWYLCPLTVKRQMWLVEQELLLANAKHLRSSSISDFNLFSAIIIITIIIIKIIINSLFIEGYTVS